MFGWEEMVAAVAKVYYALPLGERAQAAIYAGNYGEAGALEPLERRDELGEPELAGLERFETGGLKRFVGVGFGQLEQF